MNAKAYYDLKRETERRFDALEAQLARLERIVYAIADKRSPDVKALVAEIKPQGEEAA